MTDEESMPEISVEQANAEVAASNADARARDDRVYADSVEGAMMLLRYEADLDTNDVIREQLEKGTIEWIADPQVAGVWGLHVKGEAADWMRVIVYTHDGTFTVDEDWFYDQW